MPTREEYDYTPLHPRGWTPWIKRFVLTRDRWCRKCEKRDDLQIHHLREVSLGGDDHPDNLVVLCGHCHDEWTVCEPPAELLTFEAWLALPPMRVLLPFFAKAWPMDVPAGVYQVQLLGAFELLKKTRRGDA